MCTNGHFKGLGGVNLIRPDFSADCLKRVQKGVPKTGTQKCKNVTFVPKNRTVPVVKTHQKHTKNTRQTGSWQRGVLKSAVLDIKQTLMFL